MRSLLEKQRLSPILLAAVLTTGIFGVIVFLLITGDSLLQIVAGNRAQPEALDILRDGRAVIRRVQYSGRTAVNHYRTLDGKVVDDLISSSAAINLAPTDEPRMPLLFWYERLQGMADVQTWPAYWFLIRDGHVPGRGYFAIYDGQTNQLLGYFGRTGFLAEMPNVDQQFADIPVRGMVTLVDRNESRRSQETRWSRVSTVFLIADHALWQIDPAARSMQQLKLPAEPISVEVNYPRRRSDDEPIQNEYTLAVRTSDAILLLDPQGQVTRTVALPEALRALNVQIHCVDNPEVVLTAYPVPNRYDLIDVYWLRPSEENAEARHATAHLAGYSSQNGPNWAFLLFPSPVVQVFVEAITSWNMVRMRTADSFLAAWNRTLHKDRAPLAVLLIISVLAAVGCVYHHRRYAAHGAVAWAIFVFLTGVPGAIGYWLHRAWPPREACRSCEKLTPRNRDACLSCATEFAPPALTGREVLA